MEDDVDDHMLLATEAALAAIPTADAGLDAVIRAAMEATNAHTRFGNESDRMLAAVNAVVIFLNRQGRTEELARVKLEHQFLRSRGVAPSADDMPAGLKPVHLMAAWENDHKNA